MSMKEKVLALIAAAFMGTSAPASAHEDSNESFRTLSAQYWQWATSIPLARNPLADSTGANCMVGQRGPVWFLASTLAPGPVSRTCTIPEGTTLYFPVLGALNINTPNLAGQGPDNKSVSDLRAELAPIVDGVQRVKVLLDNREIKHVRRVRSVPFSVAFAQDNPFGIPDVVPGFPYSPSVDDGYYVKLNGLSEGVHHLSFTGELPAFGFSVTVDYVLNVVKVILKD